MLSKIIIPGVLLFSLAPAAVLAGCTLSPNAQYPATSAQSFAPPLDSRTFSVPPDVPVGTSFYRERIWVSGTSGWRIECTQLQQPYLFYRYNSQPMPLAAGFTNVYQSGLQGIGIRFSLPLTGPVQPFPAQTAYNGGKIITLSSNQGIGFFIELIKTAQTVTPGQFSASNFPGARLALG